MNKSFIILSLCASIFTAGCHSEHEEKEEETIFLTTSPLRKDTSIVDEYVCQIHSISHIELRSQERGFLEKFYVDEGDFVKKGQPLFEIMPTLYQAEFEKAKAEANLAEIEYRNTKSLSDSNIVSTNELAMAKARFDRAKAELELKKVHLGFTKIKAPFDGIIDRFHVRLGSLVDEGELITELSDNSQMWIYYNVPEAEYLDYMSQVKDSTKTKVKLEMANHKVFNQTGIVETIEANFNNETGNISFRATFPNPDGLLRHGETGNILMTVPLKNALLIPQKATYEILDKRYVFVIDDESKVRLTEITVGNEMPQLFAVTEGLKESDKFLLEGLRKVRNNDEIETEYEKPAEVLTQLDLYAE